MVMGCRNVPSAPSARGGLAPAAAKLRRATGERACRLRPECAYVRGIESRAAADSDDRTRLAGLLHLPRNHEQQSIHYLLEQIDVLCRRGENIVPNKVVTGSIAKLGRGAKRSLD